MYPLPPTHAQLESIGQDRGIKAEVCRKVIGSKEDSADLSDLDCSPPSAASGEESLA